MAEIVEYALVVMVSSMLAAFAFGVYGGIASKVGPAEDEAAFASVVVLANAAIEHGSSSSSIVFNQATIGCGSGAITFSTPRYSGNSSLPVRCSFEPQRVSGTEQVTFDYSDGLLTLEVH